MLLLLTLSSESLSVVVDEKLPIMASRSNSVVKTAQGPMVGPYIFGKTLGVGSTGM